MDSDIRLDGDNIELIGNVLLKRTDDSRAEVFVDMGRDWDPKDLIEHVSTYIGPASIWLSGDWGGNLSLKGGDNERRIFIDGGRAADGENGEGTTLENVLERIADRGSQAITLEQGAFLVEDIAEDLFDRPYRVYVNGVEATLVLGGDGKGGWLRLTDGDGEFTVEIDGKAGTVETKGIILRSPSGERFRLGVDDDGTLETEAV